MIPQPVKWVGAVLAMVLVVLVAAPIAFNSLLGIVSFSDESGLFSSGDQLEDLTGPGAGLDEDEDEIDALEGLDGEGDDGDEDSGDDGSDADGGGSGEDSNGDGGGSGEDSNEDGGEDSNGGEDSSGDERTYVVQGGDTLYSIADRELGDGSRWQEIADANGITDRTSLIVGDELVIP